MPQDIRAPDGSIVRFPDGMSDEQIIAVMRREYGGPDNRKASFGLGVYKGATKPLDNAAMALEAGAKRVGIPTDKINNLFGMPSAAQATDQRAQAFANAPRKPGFAGQVVGEIIGTAPVMMATRNPFAVGAGQGALLTDSRTPGGVAADAAMGAGLNYLGGKAMDAVADVIRPKVAPAVRRLQQAGVELTPGMIKGGKAMVREDKAMSRPGVGDRIAAGRQRTHETVNTAWVNEALKPLGVKLPASTKPGFDAISYAKGEIQRAYDRVIPNLAVQLNGQQFAQNIAGAARNLKPAEQKQLRQIVSNELGNGQLAGQNLKRAQGEIRRLAGKFSRSQNTNEQMLGEALKAVDDELTGAMVAQNPKYAPELQRVNSAYRGYRIAADAAGRTDEGLATTAQMRQATRRGDFSKNKDASARGEAFMQRFTRDARAVVPARAPNGSGTAAHLQSGNLFANIKGAVEGWGYEVDRAAQNLKIAPRPKQARKAARFARRLKGPAGAAAVASANSGND
ncbi:hypothetical protein [Phenylobacterium deserti]|uniref:Uncharacterized protein n=1 Tax=Phenylobacterium deserti TaxID=1914756 RepID=A0A328ABN4_9CAUL|nr:hypothetical protein [Phenylobacterium deserti]RAK52142.1 hypothetical protein DJ018_13380 [Phenylobacterium deserti]